MKELEANNSAPAEVDETMVGGLSRCMGCSLSGLWMEEPRASGAICIIVALLITRFLSILQGILYFDRLRIFCDERVTDLLMISVINKTTPATLYQISIRLAGFFVCYVPLVTKCSKITTLMYISSTHDNALASVPILTYITF